MLSVRRNVFHGKCRIVYVIEGKIEAAAAGGCEKRCIGRCGFPGIMEVKEALAALEAEGIEKVRGGRVCGVCGCVVCVGV